jgi:hypothetical protein
MNYIDEIETLLDRLAESQPSGWSECVDLWLGVAEYFEGTASNIRSAVFAHGIDREDSKNQNAIGEDS